MPDTTYYIADSDNSDPVYFEIIPTPIPILKYSIAKTKKRRLNTRDESGNIIPGATDHYAGGGDISGSYIPLRIIKMSQEIYEDIVEKMIACDSVIFSPDAGTTLYECTFSQDATEPEVIEGTELLRWEIKLDVIQTVTIP